MSSGAEDEMMPCIVGWFSASGAQRRNNRSGLSTRPVPVACGVGARFVPPLPAAIVGNGFSTHPRSVTFGGSPPLRFMQQSAIAPVHRSPLPPRVGPGVGALGFSPPMVLGGAGVGWRVQHAPPLQSRTTGPMTCRDLMAHCGLEAVAQGSVCL